MNAHPFLIEILSIIAGGQPPERNKMKNAVKLHDNDNVAVVIEPVQEGEEICYADRRGDLHSVQALQRIAIYHKAAVLPIQKGAVILKYGEPIGSASQDIQVGEHVHTHNVSDSSPTKGDCL